MKAKTYKAKTIQEALDQIKRELGAEAVILSTQSVMKRRALSNVTSVPTVFPASSTASVT